MRGILLFLALLSVVGIGQGLSRVRAPGISDDSHFEQVSDLKASASQARQTVRLDSVSINYPASQRSFRSQNPSSERTNRSVFLRTSSVRQCSVPTSISTVLARGPNNVIDVAGIAA